MFKIYLQRAVESGTKGLQLYYQLQHAQMQNLKRQRAKEKSKEPIKLQPILFAMTDLGVVMLLDLASLAGTQGKLSESEHYWNEAHNLCKVLDHKDSYEAVLANTALYRLVFLNYLVLLIVD